MALTAKQREALDALPAKRRAFVLEYLRNGRNGTEAARSVGHKGSDAALAVAASRTISDGKVQAAIRALEAPSEERKYRSVEQLREQWDEWANERAFDPKDRIKATELLAKSQGGFVERVQHEGGAFEELRLLLAERRKARRLSDGDGDGDDTDTE